MDREVKEYLPENPSGTQCDGQKATFAVGLEDERLAFGFRVVVRIERFFRVGCTFVEVDNVFAVKCDTCRARVNQFSDAGSNSCVYDCLGAVDVDFVVNRGVFGTMLGRGGVYDAGRARLRG